MHLYRNIFREALSASWKNKYLWFFGLFATLLGGISELELVFRTFDPEAEGGLYSGFSQWAQTGIFTRQGWSNILQLAGDEPFSFFILISLLLVILILGIFLVWITIVSHAALVHNSARSRLGKKHNFKNGLNAGMNKFWPVLSMNFVLKIATGLLFSFLTLPIILGEGGQGPFSNALVFVVLFLVFLPMSLILSFLTKYAVAYSIIKDKNFFDSYKESWNLFWKNWLISLEMAFSLFFISFFSALGLILLFLSITVPILFVIILFSQILLYVNILVIIIGAMILYLVAIIVFGSFMTTFQVSSWTNLFIELISKGGASKLNRIFSKA